MPQPPEISVNAGHVTLTSEQLYCSDNSNFATPQRSRSVRFSLDSPLKYSPSSRYSPTLPETPDTTYTSNPIQVHRDLYLCKHHSSDQSFSHHAYGDIRLKNGGYFDRHSFSDGTFTGRPLSCPNAPLNAPTDSQGTHVPTPAIPSFPSSGKTHLLKTKVCNLFLQGRCFYGSECFYAHNLCELRKSPSLRKTSLCKLHLHSRCRKSSEECSYAHSTDELSATYKSVLCMWWLNGHCSHGDNCRFAHGDHELKSGAVDYHAKSNLRHGGFMNERALSVEGRKNFIDPSQNYMSFVRQVKPTRTAPAGRFFAPFSSSIDGVSRSISSAAYDSIDSSDELSGSEDKLPYYPQSQPKEFGGPLFADASAVTLQESPSDFTNFSSRIRFHTDICESSERNPASSRDCFVRLSGDTTSSVSDEPQIDFNLSICEPAGSRNSKSTTTNGSAKTSNSNTCILCEYVETSDGICKRCMDKLI